MMFVLIDNKKNIIIEKIIVLNKGFCNKMIHTLSVVAFKQDGEASNRVNLSKIQFPPHSFIDR